MKKITEKSNNIRLLFVEDESVSRELMMSILKNFFVDITVAVDGLDGFEKFQKNKIDLIITDINMPNMNGFEMIKKIRGIDENTSIVVLSAYSEAEYFIKGIELGVDGYLLKPFDLEQFVSVLGTLLKNIQLKKEIKEVKERTELALLGSKTSILDWDLTNNNFYISSNWKEMLGFSDEELSNNISTWNQRVHRDDKKVVFSLLDKIETDKIEFFENIHRLEHKDGSWVWVLGRAKILYDTKGKAIRMVGTHTDITEEKELQLKATHRAQIIEQIHDSVISTDLDGVITSWNAGSESLLGYKSDEMIGQHISMIYREEDIKSFQENIDLLMKNGEYHTFIRMIKKSKDIVDVDLSLSILRDEKGKPIGRIGYSKDITIRRAAEIALKEQHSYLQSIIDGVNDPIMVIKEDYTTSLMNHELRKTLKNIKIANSEQPKCYEIFYNRSEPCNGIDYPCPLMDVMKTKEHISVVHTRYIDDKKHYIDISATPLFDKEKNCIGVIESSRNITSHLETRDELEEQKNILYYQAHHDVVTRFPNRTFFNKKLKEEIRISKENNMQFALFFIDIDHFKEINDSLGHRAGDEVLKVVASRINQVIREKDVLARLGGDEFTVIMKSIQKVKNVSILAEKILNIFREPITIDSHMIYISSSIGISLYPDDGNVSHDLLKYADAAMYKAKGEGRNNFQYYNTKMTKLALERIVMATDLRKSLVNEDFLVYYQPQVNAESNRITGMEALVRWQHPTMGLIYPDKFISLAMSTGIIIEMDRFVMRVAMAQIAKWYEKGLMPGILALNLTQKQLLKKDFISMLENILEETKCNPKWIEFEVTEEQIMTDPIRVIEILKQIRDMGIKLAIDDFGTGYSSLSHLKKLPIDMLKIDQSFIQDIPNNKEDVIITKSIISLAKSLCLKVIAEGVEIKEQKEFLVENGCKNIQGNFYSKAIPSSEMEQVLLRYFIFGEDFKN